MPKIKSYKKHTMLNQIGILAEDIVESARDSLVVMDAEFKVVYANNLFYKTFKVEETEIEGYGLFELCNRQWGNTKLRQLLEDIVSSDRVVENFEIEQDFAKVGLRIMNINARRIIKKDDADVFILMVIEDVTEKVNVQRKLDKYKKHLEELIELRSQELLDVNKKLIEEKELLNITLRSIGDAVIATDIKGRVTILNHSAERLTGWSEEAAAGKPLSDVFNIVNKVTREKIEGIAEKIIDSKSIINFESDTILFSKDGRELLVVDSGAPIRDIKGSVNGAVIVFRDITEEKWREDELRQSYKMESIGTLAGGIAHDFNNILFAIMGNTDLAMLRQKKDSKALKYLQNIYQSCHRAKDLVLQILTFSRQTKQVFSPIVIDQVANEAIKLLKASLPSSITIHADISCNSRIIADPTQIYQVIYNLCTNAAQAIKDDIGVIHINLKEVEILNEISEVIRQNLRPGKYVKLSVADSGHGISSEIRDRIFDPFFTTKDIGKGTGMGLSVVHGIIKNHNGSILVYSEPGEGTVFDVYFPVVEKKVAESIGERPFEPFPTGNERVLLVDDEYQIVQLEHQMLEKLGYKVTRKSSSVAALDAFRAEPDLFDLVITDMTMPQMNGYQLSKKIKQTRPDIPIILCSGYSEKISENKTKEIGISAFVLKPLTMRELAQIIRRVLDSEIDERRQNERFRMKEHATAIFRSDPVREYDIVDISWGGLAINSTIMQIMQEESDELAITISCKGIILDKIPCKLITDSELLSGSISNIEERMGRQRIEFGEMENTQLNVLDHLINNFTETGGIDTLVG